MSQTILTCGGCSTRYNVSSLNPGQKIRCKKCSQILQVPAPAAEAPQQPAAEPAAQGQAGGQPAAKRKQAAGGSTGTGTKAPKAPARSSRLSKASGRASSRRRGAGGDDGDGGGVASRRGRRGRSSRGDGKNPALLWGGIGGVVVIAAVAVFLLGGESWDAKEYWATEKSSVGWDYSDAVALLPEDQRVEPTQKQLDRLAQAIRQRENDEEQLDEAVLQIRASNMEPGDKASRLVGQISTMEKWLKDDGSARIPALYEDWVPQKQESLLAQALELDPDNDAAHRWRGDKTFRPSPELRNLTFEFEDMIPKELLEAEGTWVTKERFEELEELQAETIAEIEQFKAELVDKPELALLRQARRKMHADIGFGDREWADSGLEFWPVVVFAEKKSGFDSEAKAAEKAAMIKHLHTVFKERYVEPFGIEVDEEAIFPLIAVVVQKRADYESIMEDLGTGVAGGQIAHYHLSSKKIIMYDEISRGQNKKEIMMNNGVVFHESTHQMVDAYDGDMSFRDSPHSYFFVEGFAEFVGNCDQEGDDWMLEQKSLYRIDELKGLMNAGEKFPHLGIDELVFSLKELWDIPHAGFVGPAAMRKWQNREAAARMTSGYYAQSWSVHYFLHNGAGGKYRDGHMRLIEWEMTGKVHEMLTDEGKSGSQIVMEALGISDSDLPAMEEDWRTFCREQLFE